MSSVNDKTYKELIKKYETPPNKPHHDTKEYSVIILKNGLTALLISDIKNVLPIDENTISKYENDVYDSSTYDKGLENCKQDEKLAACSLTVGGAGSFNDFEEIPGLAHFVEHMLMMGSEKYPEENDFTSFISKVGGTDNASTEFEDTTFYFDCPEVHLYEALKRFSSFFKSPLMRKESMTREREAVESEFQMNFSSDSCRAEQIFSTTAMPENPASKFTWGNLKTLQENISDDDLYEAIHKFWKRYYLANRMTVAIQARLPMEVLERWVAENFSDIQSNNKAVKKLPTDNLFNMDLFNKIYIIEPIQNKTELHVTWVLPPEKYKTKPTSYISFLIGHEGEGSLTSYFQKQLWGLNLMAGCGDRGIEKNSMYSTFTIEIDLTTEGLKNYENVIKTIFSYIKLLQKTGPVEWIFKEIQTTYETCFNFSQEKSPYDYVEVLSQRMQRFPSTDYLTGSQLIFEYNPDDIMNILNVLTPDSANIMLWSKTLAEEEKLDRTEPWFNTRYKIKTIQDELIHDWENLEMDPELHLPKPNSYLTTDFNMLPTTSDDEGPPEKIISNYSIEVWYKSVTKFRRPIGYINIYLISPIAVITVKNSVMMDLLVSIFRHNIQEEAYPATVASLSYTVNPSFSGIIITVNGFNQKLHLFLNRILVRLTDFKKDTKEGLFNIVKQNLYRDYMNYCEDPDVLVSELRIKLLVHPFWTNVDKLQIIKDITLENLLDYNDQFFKNLYVKCLIQGNISQKEASDIISDFRNTIKYKPINPGTFPDIKMIELPKGESYLRVKAMNEDDKNCNVTNYYQTTNKGHIEESSKIELLMLIMSEPLYDVLRTQEQLAYDISCSFRDTFNVLGWIICVKSQADKYAVDYIEERITEFLKCFEIKLKEMSTNEFNNYKKTFIRLKQQADTHTYHEVQRNWIEILANDYYFKKHMQQIEYIETLGAEDLYNHFKNTLTMHDNEDEIGLRKLSVQVDAEVTNRNDIETELDEEQITPNGDKSEENRIEAVKGDEDEELEEIEIIYQKPDSENKMFIKDIQEFKINQPYHLVKIFNQN